MNVSGTKPVSGKKQVKDGHRDLLFFGAYTLALVSAIFLAQIRTQSDAYVWRADVVQVAGGDEPQFALPGYNSSEWAWEPINRVLVTDKIQWFRLELNLELGKLAREPYGLFLAGPFSAEVYWDGRHLGNKGQVGNGPDNETPGPIQSIIYLPDYLTTPGRHLLALRVSSFHAADKSDQVFYEVALGSHRADPRRELRSYTLPLLTSGGFLLLGLMFVFLGRSGHMEARLLALFSGLVLCQLCVEILPSLIAYPYDWHLYRNIAIMTFAVLAGTTLDIFVFHRLKKRFIGYLILPAVVLALLALKFLKGIDAKTVGAIWVLSSVPLVAGAIGFVRRKGDRLVYAAALLAVSWLVGGWVSQFYFLDRGYYLTSFVFLAALWYLITHPGKREAGEPEEINHFCVRGTGKLERVEAAEVVILHAVGNYVELVCSDERVILHQHRLGQIMKQPPKGFFRIHRSYAVNLSHLRSLKSLEGSRYRAEMSNGTEVPVSRNKVAELREKMNKPAPAQKRETD